MYELPFSYKIDNKALSRVFKNTSATYKYYWFLSILDEADKGNREILKFDLFSNMICLSYYPISKYKLNFGSQDNLDKYINSCEEYLGMHLKMTGNKIKNILKQSYKKKDEVYKDLKKLNENVPHWFLTPWFPKSSKTTIYKNSLKNDSHSPYKLEGDKIILNENWYYYFRKHSLILRHFTLWNLSCFVQKRNPNSPNIINKLVKPIKRNPLTKQRKYFWDIYFNSKKSIRCIFTNKELKINNYHLDHFVPFSFVTHDLIWNLVPVDPDFNGMKSDSLPLMKMHFEKFYALQKDALDVLGNDLKDSFKEEYLSIFNKFDNIHDFEFNRFKNTIEPLISVASNNGFEFLE